MGELTAPRHGSVLPCTGTPPTPARAVPGFKSVNLECLELDAEQQQLGPGPWACRCVCACVCVCACAYACVRVCVSVRGGHTCAK